VDEVENNIDRINFKISQKEQKYDDFKNQLDKLEKIIKNQGISKEESDKIESEIEEMR